MSLSAREQQALDAMEDRLAGSDPGLARLLATFARLTSDEQMPVREKIRAASRRRLHEHLGFQGAVGVLWLLIAIVLVAVALLAGSPGRSPASCAKPWPLVCTSPVAVHPTGSP